MDTVLGEPFGQLVQSVEPEEEIAQRDLFRIRRQCQVALVNTLRIKFVEGDFNLTSGFGTTYREEALRRE